MSSPTTKTPRRPVGATGATSEDDFLGGRIRVLQPLQGHRAGSDAVFLAASTPADSGDRVLDAGSGVGTAALCLLARVPKAELTAVEIDPELCALAERNAALNGAADRLTVVNTDITSGESALAAAGLKREGYHHIFANPPFHVEDRVRAAPDRRRAAAHVMRKDGLAGWVRFFAAMAAPGGSLTVIHRPDGLAELLQLLDGRFGEARVFPLFPKQRAPAVRIIVQARQGSRAGLTLLPGLVLHRCDGSYAEEAERVLRAGEALVLRDRSQKKGRRPGG